MSISLEALAMMGNDYIKDGITLEEYEKHEEQVPPYLLVHDEEEEDENLFSSWKKNMSTKNSYENNYFCYSQEEEKKKKPLSGNQILLEFLEKKDIESFMRLVGIIIVYNMLIFPQNNNQRS